ncbi:MAG TPA: hypothetical protein VGL75_02640 [Acidothermaceae bacterium]|jgi:hypothetical protein
MSGQGGVLTFSSAVSAFTGEPFVLTTWGHESGQMTPDEAIACGMDAIEAAVAAKHDAAIAAVLKRLGFEPQEIAATIVGLRIELKAQR